MSWPWLPSSERPCSLSERGDIIWRFDDKDLVGSKLRFGNFLEFDIDDIVEIIDHLRHNEQTITQFGMVSHDIFEALAASGRMVDRIVPVGDALSMSMQWDGKHRFSAFCRVRSRSSDDMGASEKTDGCCSGGVDADHIVAGPTDLGCLTVLFTMGRPVFFMHERSGKNGVPFRIIKLRTMVNDPDGKMTDSERVTRRPIVRENSASMSFHSCSMSWRFDEPCWPAPACCANMMRSIPPNSRGGFK